MLNILKPRPLLSQESAQWILHTLDWAINHFDQRYFSEHIELITPSPLHFPDKVSDAHEMASYVFSKTLDYSGLSHLPLTLVQPHQWQAKALSLIDIDTTKRGCDAPILYENIEPFALSYHPEQLKQPSDLLATFAFNIAQYCLLQSRLEPPGGKDYFAQASEVLAISMGFGLVFANTAYTFKGGCGSCYNPSANRIASLTESEAVFALAAFCKRKDVGNDFVFTYLKKHLRGEYKRALKQLKA